MKRADNYRGRRPRGGLTAEQAMVICAVVLAAVLVLTMRVNARWTGMSVGEQVRQALFVAKDWH